MFLKQFCDPFLAQYSYIIGCQSDRSAIVIDPLRDVEQYLKAAKLEEYNLIACTETHIHADFLSGCKQLSEHENVTAYLSDEGNEDWKYNWIRNSSCDFRMLRDQSVIKIGNVELKAIHTPGHTPEHLSFLITDTTKGQEIPMGIVTGDFIFVGDLGRPDLLESVLGAKGETEMSAGQLYESVKSFLEFPEYLQIWPGHGAGSACGKEISAVPESSVGYEKRMNKSIQAFHKGKVGFIKSIVKDQSDPPLYFKNMKIVNRDVGAKKPSKLNMSLLEHQELNDILKDSSIQIIDTRQDQTSFMKKHFSGSIHIGLNKSFPKSAGSYIQPDDDLVIVVDNLDQCEDVYNTLMRIGFDNIKGFMTMEIFNQIPEDFQGFSRIEMLTFDDIVKHTLNEDQLILDVRNTFEFEHGHIRDAVNIPFTNLPLNLDQLPKNRKLIVHCTSGNTASAASSLLKSKGYNSTYVNDKWENYRGITDFHTR
jgi:hydroxyacylglutathione hydrolase